MLAVRLGSYETGGMLSLAVSLTNVFYVLATFSIRVFQASDTAGRFPASRYVSTRVVTSLFGTALCVVFTLCNRQYSAAQSWSIILYMVFKLSESLVDTLAAEQQKAWRMDYCGRSFFMRGVASLGSFVLMLVLTGSLPLALLVMAAVTMPIVLLYDWRIVTRLTGRIRLDLRRSEWQPLLAAAWPMMVNSLMMTMMTAIPKYMLERCFGSTVMGIYGSIATPAVIVQAGCSFVYSPLIAPLSEQYNRGDIAGFRKTVLTALGAVLGFTLLMLGGAAVLGEWGLRLLFGESILPYAPLLIPVLLTSLCMALLYFFEVPLTIMRRLKTMTAIHLCAIAVCAVLSLTVVPSMGMEGVNLTVYLSAGLDALAMGIAVAVLSRRGKAEDEKE